MVGRWLSYFRAAEAVTAVTCRCPSWYSFVLIRSAKVQPASCWLDLMQVPSIQAVLLGRGGAVSESQESVLVHVCHA